MLTPSFCISVASFHKRLASARQRTANPQKQLEVLKHSCMSCNTWPLALRLHRHSPQPGRLVIRRRAGDVAHRVDARNKLPLASRNRDSPSSLRSGSCGAGAISGLRLDSLAKGTFLVEQCVCVFCNEPQLQRHMRSNKGRKGVSVVVLSSHCHPSREPLITPHTAKRQEAHDQSDGQLLLYPVSLLSYKHSAS